MLVPILVGLVESSGPAYRDADCAVGGFDAIDLDVSRRLRQVQGIIQHALGSGLTKAPKFQ
jgi:hypothetical protein